MSPETEPESIKPENWVCSDGSAAPLPNGDIVIGSAFSAGPAHEFRNITLPNPVRRIIPKEKTAQNTDRTTQIGVAALAAEFLGAKAGLEYMRTQTKYPAGNTTLLTDSLFISLLFKRIKPRKERRSARDSRFVKFEDLRFETKRVYNEDDQEAQLTLPLRRPSLLVQSFHTAQRNPYVIRCARAFLKEARKHKDLSVQTMKPIFLELHEAHDALMALVHGASILGSGSKNHKPPLRRHLRDHVEKRLQQLEVNEKPNYSL